MTSTIFLEWLRIWDRELQKNSRNILLLIDNCAAHPKSMVLKNIRVEFLPPNTTSLIQPLDMGIIKNLKCFYRSKLVNHILQEVEENLLNTASTAIDVSARVNLLQAIQFLADSWRQVSKTTIQNCFSHCGFTPTESTEEAENQYVNDAMSLIQQVTNVDEFLQIDENCICVHNEECDDAIVEKLTCSATDETNNEQDEPERVTIQNAKNCIAELQQYFMQEGSEGSPLPELQVCANFVERMSVKHNRQSRLDDFFQRI